MTLKNLFSKHKKTFEKHGCSYRMLKINQQSLVHFNTAKIHQLPNALPAEFELKCLHPHRDSKHHTNLTDGSTEDKTLQTN